MKKLLRIFLIVVVFAAIGGISTNAQAQRNVQLKGTVVDEQGAPLVGAMVAVMGSTKSAMTDVDGDFSLKVAPKEATIQVSFYGYTPQDVEFDGENGNLGTITLKFDVINIDEVAVMASIVRSDRQTPVPISNVTFDAIESKISNLEFPELFKTTPSVYVTRGSGGFGDSRINMRGFDSANLGILINGVPINGMENGKVYWSNWSSLSDVTEFTQIQRGLGASSLGLSSVGGTMNMVTFGTKAKRGGSVYTGIGNDGYKKVAATFSTGMLENGWAVTLSGSMSTGDGYIKGTNYEAYSYFGNVSKTIGSDHKLSFTIFGAPQWHNQRATGHYLIDYKNSPEGGRLNNSYGYVNGEIVGGAYAYNTYHKPQASLNHYWQIDEKSSLTTSVYGSVATGGGRRTAGNNKYALSIDYKTGRPTADTYMTNDGLLDYDRVYAENAANVNGSQTIFANAINDHEWYGLLSSYKNEIVDGLTLTAGLDARYYKGYHGTEITDLLGGDYYVESYSSIYGREANTPLHEGDLIDYYYTGEIFWAGLFGQLEYSNDHISAFVSASATGEGYRMNDTGSAPEYYYDGVVYDADDVSRPAAAVMTQTSDLVSFLPWSVKGGFNYKINENHNLFVNAGYFTRAPYFNAVFADYNIGVNKGAKYERIMTYELGYGFSNDSWNVAVNGYYTNWMDKFLRRTIAQDISANIPGMNAVHYGVEAEVTFRPTDKLNIRGMASWGDWTWSDDVSFTVFDDKNQALGTYNAYVAGVHVGDAAQATAAISASWEFLEGLKLNADYTYAGKNYANFDPSNRTNIADKGVDSWQMPDYYTIDLGLNYRFNITKGVKGSLYVNVNNLTNVQYVADATDGVDHNMQTALVYYGFGTTWTTGIKIMF